MKLFNHGHAAACPALPPLVRRPHLVSVVEPPSAATFIRQFFGLPDSLSEYIGGYDWVMHALK
jgi:hypothetical protein